MKIKEITASVDIKIHVGNYETFSCPVALKAELEFGEDPDECSATLNGMVTKMWAKEALRKLRMYRSFREDKKSFDEATKLVVAELKNKAQ